MEGNNNDGNKDQIVDVRSVVEAVSAEDGDVPVYNVESLCMRCGQNVCCYVISLFLATPCLKI